MKELERILRRHARRYPRMAPADAVKLIYQNEFGGGHLIQDEQAVRAYLHREFDEVPKNASQPRYEDIGNGLVRVHLAALRETELDGLADDFIGSAADHRGNLPRFLEKLDVLRHLTAACILPFDADDLEDYLQAYALAGYPMVSHSEAYRQAYRPAYRIVTAPPAFVQITAAIDRLLQTRSSAVVAIDGRCGAGKTTLANALRHHYGCSVIPMDHFFLRPEQRTAERLAAPGGNIDYERFLEDVLRPLHQGEGFSYRPFDCSTMTLGAPVPVNAAGLTVIEGSYACHPKLWDCYDLRLFLTVDPEKQMRRLAARNGAYAQVFRDKWIPLEERYFESYDLETRCDCCYTT